MVPPGPGDTSRARARILEGRPVGGPDQVESFDAERAASRQESSSVAPRLENPARHALLEAALPFERGRGVCASASGAASAGKKISATHRVSLLTSGSEFTIF